MQLETVIGTRAAIRGGIIVLAAVAGLATCNAMTATGLAGEPTGVLSTTGAPGGGVLSAASASRIERLGVLDGRTAAPADSMVRRSGG